MPSYPAMFLAKPRTVSWFGPPSPAGPRRATVVSPALTSMQGGRRAGGSAGSPWRSGEHRPDIPGFSLEIGGEHVARVPQRAGLLDRRQTGRALVPRVEHVRVPAPKLLVFPGTDRPGRASGGAAHSREPGPDLVPLEDRDRIGERGRIGRLGSGHGSDSGAVSWVRVMTVAGWNSFTSPPPLIRETCLRTAFISPMRAPVRRSNRLSAILSSRLTPSTGRTRSEEQPPSCRRRRDRPARPARRFPALPGRRPGSSRRAPGGPP